MAVTNQSTDIKNLGAVGIGFRPYGVVQDAYIVMGDPDQNFGKELFVRIGYNTIAGVVPGTFRGVFGIRVIPAVVFDAELIGLLLHLYAFQRFVQGVTPQKVRAFNVEKAICEGEDTDLEGITGSGVTWNKYDGANDWVLPGGDLLAMLKQIDVDAISQWYDWDLTAWVQTGKVQWEKQVYCIIKNAEESGAGQAVVWDYRSTEYAVDTTKRPYITIYWRHPKPKYISDLAVSATPTDPRKFRLAWSKDEEEGFVSYQIQRDTASITSYDAGKVKATITDPFTTTWDDPDLLTDNTKYYYRIWVSNLTYTDGDGTLSNEVIASKPSVTNIVLNPASPLNVWQKTTATITATNNCDPLRKVTEYFYDWDGDHAMGADGKFDGTAIAQSPLNTRDHVWSKAMPAPGGQNYFVRAKNDLGVWSNSLGANVVVNGIAPIARLRVSPTQSEIGEQVTFDLSESYDQSGKLINGYYVDFGDGTTTGGWLAGPVIFHTYSSESWTAGGKWAIIARCKNELGSVSDDVTAEVRTITETPFDLLTGLPFTKIQYRAVPFTRRFAINRRLGGEGAIIVPTASEPRMLDLKGSTLYEDGMQDILKLQALTQQARLCQMAVTTKNLAGVVTDQSQTLGGTLRSMATPAYQPLVPALFGVCKVGLWIGWNNPGGTVFTAKLYEDGNAVSTVVVNKPGVGGPTEAWVLFDFAWLLKPYKSYVIYLDAAGDANAYWHQDTTTKRYAFIEYVTYSSPTTTTYTGVLEDLHLTDQKGEVGVRYWTAKMIVRDVA